MPRLLRIGFSAIGHSHARLAPLTLDFRHDRGTGTDSVLWLRNAGGKSSILNLFFSIFRPDRREFLGTNAEGKARRLEDYVKGSDLAFVVTEWDVDPPATADLFDQTPRGVRVVGQVLAWRGQQRSGDVSRLRRLFFSFRADADRHAAFDDLPIAGLNPEPVASFEDFRVWLQELFRRHPDLEVVQEESQKRWIDHLERLGLDPELFRYQIRMNLREGAADELFRFDRATDFVRFLLELALDTTRADQVSANLSQLRERLRHRPELVLEESFVRAVLAELEPLVDEVALLRQSEEDLTLLRQEAGGVGQALLIAAETLAARGAAAAEELAAAEAAETAAASQQRSNDRGAAGLLRLARRLGLAEAQARLDAAQHGRQEADRRVRELRAALLLAELRRLQAELGARQEAVRQSELAREPLIRLLQQAGSVYWELADAGLRLVKENLRQREEELQALAQRLDVLRRGELSRQREEAEVGERIRTLEEQIARRDAARARLRQQGVIEQREEAADALVRWGELLVRAQRSGEEAEQEEERVATALAEVEEQRLALEAESVLRTAEVRQVRQQLERAEAWRDRLAEHPRLADVEEAESVDPWADGLLARVRSRAEALHRHLLKLRVDAAEDERALTAVEQRGLLPPSRDAEEALDGLRERGIPCFSALEYLASNASEEEATALLLSDPGRYSGLVVPRPELLGRVQEIAERVSERLRGPVAVTVAGLEPGPEVAMRVVLGPGQRGSYVPRCAQERQAELAALQARRRAEEERQRAEQRELEAVASDLARLLEELPRPRFLALGEQLQTAQALRDVANAGLARLGGERTRLQQRRDDARKAGQRARKELDQARQASTRLQEHLTTHEKELPQLRESLDRLRLHQQELLAALAGAREEIEQQREQRRTLEGQHRELSRLRQQREAERDAIHHRSAAPVPVEGATLEQAAARYRQLLATYQHETSENRLQWELEQVERTLGEQTARYRQAAEGIDPAALEALLAQGELAAALVQAESLLASATLAVGEARQEVRAAEEQLKEPPIRRTADDLPPLEQPVETSAQACQLAEQYRQGAEQAAAAREEATRRRHAQERAAEACAVAAEQRRMQHQLLESKVDLLPPERPPARIPETSDGVALLVRDLLQRFHEKFGAFQRRRQQAAATAERARQVALDDRFAAHRSQVRERLKAEPAELLTLAAEYAPKLRDRLEILRRDLAELDSHRRLLIGALDGVAAEGIRLLRRVGPASQLPPALEGWGGRPYLEIRFEIPSVEAERQQRLEPLVDRLVQEAHLPGGLELAQLAVEELTGERGFEVSLLKPDTVLRPERLPVTALSTFSRGQQLTAAVLLYCTLVRLRALSRGRGHGLPDAGVLLLDNPIGTCSSVPLLELQRAVAREMRVQLVYTTGVHDLEALATLPNVIRLRNAYRERLTGDNHVTLEQDETPAPAESAVSSVRVMEVGR